MVQKYVWYICHEHASHTHTSVDAHTCACTHTEAHTHALTASIKHSVPLVPSSPANGVLMFISLFLLDKTYNVKRGSLQHSELSCLRHMDLPSGLGEVQSQSHRVKWRGVALVPY